MKFPSRNKQPSNIIKVKCPYCSHEYLTDDESESDYYTFKNTKIHICRDCGNEFINGITKDIEYKYSGKCKRKGVGND